MGLIDLTMPLYAGMPGGHGSRGFETHPMWPEPFKMEETRSYESAGMEMHVFTVFCEARSSLILASFRKEFKSGSTLDTIDLNKLVMRDTVILDVPKGEDGIVEAEELETAFNKAPCQKGDGLLVRTGWGDDERYLKLGVAYRENSPHLNNASAEKLMELMAKNESDLFLFDMCDMSGVDKRTGIRGGFAMHAEQIFVGGLVNCGEIKKERVKLIILPLKVKGVAMAPCYVVAIEE